MDDRLERTERTRSIADRLKDVRIGYLTSVSGTDGADGLRTSHGLGRMLTEIQRRCGRLTIAWSEAPDPQEVFNHRVGAAACVDYIPLPHLPSIAAGLRHDGAVRQAIRQLEAVSDVVLVQMPFSPPTALFAPRRPRLYHLCADVLGVVRASDHYRGLRRPAALGAAHAMDRLQHRLFHRENVRVVTNGRALFEHYGRPPGRYVVSSSIMEEEVGSLSRRRGSKDAFRILFVGHLRPEKGTEVLYEAFMRVRQRLPGATLHVVGDVDLSEMGAAEQLRERMAALVAEGAVHLCGHVPFGPLLFQMYADADVLVCPSRSEGTPRVLVEARAFGCPVVGSRVGGIPTSITDGEDGLLVPPDDAAASAAALLRIAEDAALRETLTANGYAFARQHTVERFVERLLGEAGRLLPSSSR